MPPLLSEESLDLPGSEAKDESSLSSSSKDRVESLPGRQADLEIHDMRLEMDELKSHVVHIRTDIARSAASSNKAIVVTGVLIVFSVALALAAMNVFLPPVANQPVPSGSSMPSGSSDANAKSMAELRSEFGQLRGELKTLANQLAPKPANPDGAESAVKPQARLDCAKLRADVKADIVDFSIRFDVGSSKIPSDSEGTLNSIAKLLALSPDLCVLIEGYTDETGDADKNMELSVGRAGSVANYLALRPGIKRDRLVAIGKGSSSSVPGLAPSNPLNRRVVFKIVSSGE